MLEILLKSSACLAVFMLFYKLCLEKTSAHTFKRFYLIGVILISTSIPFITFTEYIEVQATAFIPNQEFSTSENLQIIESTSLTNYLPSILWSIYFFGVSIFAFRFFKNLFQLFQKIKRNPKFKNENTFHVLLQELITPHTFFNYIFFNKVKYECNQIPEEVLLHEQTHAKQKHALDIMFIELLQILFWFNPLLYFIKKDIKLNHEFLADQAVINKGTNTKNYQQLLLAFSSNVSHSPLANAINYSLIKKRFTVMKTKSSKTTLWLRSLIVLPLLAVLIYGFSSRNIIEKQLENSVIDKEGELVDSRTNSQEGNYLKKNEQTSKSTLLIKVIDNETIYINNKKCPLENLEKHIIDLVGKLSTKEKEELSSVIIHNSPDGDETFWILNNILRKHNLLRTNLKPEINISQETNTIYINNQQKATQKQIEEYNKLAKKYNAQPENKRIIKLKDLNRLEYLYGLMTKEQKAEAEPFPNCPPPPPAPKAPNTKEILDINPPEAPEPPKIKEIIKVPPTPPAPKSPLDHVIDMAKKGAKFYYNLKSASLLIKN